MQNSFYNHWMQKLGMMLLIPCSLIANTFSKIQDKRISDITLLCAHNATSNLSKGPSLVADQTLTLEELMQAGVRVFKVPIHIGIYWDVDFKEDKTDPFSHLSELFTGKLESAVVAHALAPSNAKGQTDAIFDRMAQSPVIKSLKDKKIPGFNELFESAFKKAVSMAADTGVMLSKLSWPIDPSALSLKKFLITLRIFLEQNPREIIIITPNINIAETKDFDHIIKAFEESDIIPYLYLHNAEKPWPTIQDLVNTKKRFMCLFQHADEYATNIAKYYGESHWLSKIASMSLLSINTQYAYSTIEEFTTKECCIFGASCGIMGTTPYLMNMQHFITEGLAGNRDIAQKANKPDIIWPHIKHCSAATGLLPNFIMLDFLTQESIKNINEQVIMPLNTNRSHYQNTLIPQSNAKIPCAHCTN